MSPIRLGARLAGIAMAAAVGLALAPSVPAAAGTDYGLVCFRYGRGATCVTPHPGCNLTPPGTFGVANRTHSALWISRGSDCDEPHRVLGPGASLFLPPDQYSYRYLPYLPEE